MISIVPHSRKQLMAENVVNLALETLRELLVQGLRFLSGVGREVKEVQSLQQRMQCFLEDVDKRKHEECSVRNYVKQIRDLAYRIENIVETYAAKVASKRERKDICSMLKRFACMLRESTSLHKVGSQIADIKTEISNLTASMESFGIKAAMEKESSDARNERRK